MKKPPRFAVVVSEHISEGWRLAALIQDEQNLDYFCRGISVRWPYLIARPLRTDRKNDAAVDKELPSPVASLGAHSLVVNWGWEPFGSSHRELRFFVRRMAPAWLPWPTRVKVRLSLKELGHMSRRSRQTVRSRRIWWDGKQ
ncbi:MAG: hypothetical protein JO227_04460 [Acetobacteraceae bacterium]|nr:hypothetical protein [Acetobacteraceae bacterium]